MCSVCVDILTSVSVTADLHLSVDVRLLLFCFYKNPFKNKHSKEIIRFLISADPTFVLSLFVVPIYVNRILLNETVLYLLVTN